MQAAGFQLGIDFGTSHTVAVMRWPDGRAKPLLFDGSPLLPSAVYLDATGQLLVGRDALDSARLDPSRLEPNPKRRIDEGTVLLGDRVLPVAAVIAAVLGVVGTEAARTAGGRPAVVTVTCPAAWGTPRRRVLLDAAVQAGLGNVRMVEEPVAAATYFAQVLGYQMPVGSAVVVYDFGGGTFDVSLVERTASGFRTRAVDGRDDIGGLDLDEELVQRIGAVYGPRSPDGWRRLVEPTTTAERRERRLFREDIRIAKERLSRHPTADLHLPGMELDAHVTREEFEVLARPLLDQTIWMTARVAGHAGFPRERLAGVFLVGGASRIPLVSTLVHRGLQMAPRVLEQPELVVAEGSILVHSVVAVTAEQRPAAAPVAPAPVAPILPTPVPPAPVPPAPAPTPGSALAPPPATTASPPPVSAPPSMPVSGVPTSAAPASLPPVSAPPSVPVSGSPISAAPASPPPLAAPVSGAPPVATPDPPPPGPGPYLPSPAGPSRSRWASPRLRWTAAGVAVAVVAAVVIVVLILGNGGGSGGRALPAVCGLASPVVGSATLAPGQPGPPPGFVPPDSWGWYQDPSGFRVAYPKDWGRFGSGACFGDQGERRYLAIGQWQQPDADLVGYWTRKDAEVAGSLSGYRKISIKNRPNYFDGAADWEFTFEEDGETIHVLAVALVSGTRGYAYLWAAKEPIWRISEADFSLINATFQPAR